MILVLRSLPFVLSAVLGATLVAQKDPGPNKESKDADEVAKVVKKDPFTGGEEKGMKALGIVAYAPMPWVDGKRTGDVEKILGENRILWMETEHFRLGCTLGAAAAPEDPEARKLLGAEMQRLKKRWSKMPDRASRIDPWLRFHLYAQRCEELYEDFAKLCGHDPAAKTFLGQKDKFTVLLFQKKSDLARYLDSFCGRKSESSQRHYYGGSQATGIVITAENQDFYDEPGVHSIFRFNLLQAFMDARGGAPYWLSTGVAHWYERQIPSNLITCAIRDDESVDQYTQHKWKEKMKARAPRETLCIPFAQLCKETDLGYWGHVQAWSRVDHLISVDRGKFSEFLTGIKGGASAAAQEQLLQQVYGMDGPTCDAKWRDWVAKAYK